MISQPEYVASSLELDRLAHQHEVLLEAKLSSTKTIDGAISIATNQSAVYHQQAEALIHQTLIDVGTTVVDHYDSELGLRLTAEQKRDLVQYYVSSQYTESYYGTTLYGRFHWNRYQQAMRITKSSRVGLRFETRILNLTRIFRHSFPFGAAVHADRRVMLSQAVKLEHDIAKEMGDRAGAEYVKWTLSHRHKVRDICDELATYEHPETNQPGVYPINAVPQPPHPNCQCVLVFLHGDRATSTVAERTVEKLRELIGRFRKRRPK